MRELIVGGLGLALLWLLGRRRTPEGTAELGPLIHGPALAPSQPVPEVPFVPEGPFVPGPIPGTRCPVGGDGSKLCPHTGVLLPYDEFRKDPTLFSSPTGLSPDSELEVLNRFRYPVS